jgi:hypothetical protein
LSVSGDVRKQLVFHNALINDVKAKRRRILTLATIKKYRMRKWANKELKIDVRSLVPPKSKGNRPIDDVTRCKIERFFERDDVSRQTAGKRETVTRKGVKKQRRYLLQSMKKLHHNYNAGTRNFQVSYSTFYRNKSFWMLKPKADRRDEEIRRKNR